MVLLQKISESAIVENLKKRLMEDCIYVSFTCTCISCSVAINFYGNITHTGLLNFDGQPGHERLRQAVEFQFFA